MPRALLFAPVLLALSLGSARALAEDDDPTADPHYHNHDGFYLSLALGPTYVSSSLSTSAGSGGTVQDATTGTTSSSIDTTIGGTALGGHLLIGGTPVEGLVVGGGSMGNFVFSSNRSWNGTTRPMHAYSMGMLGPFVDYYFDPHEGLHLQALVGVADVTENSQGSTTNTVWGYGGAFGFGNDWWVGPNWSLGVLFRGQLARVSTSNDANVVSSSPGNPDLLATGLSETQTLWSAGLLMTATYH